MQNEEQKTRKGPKMPTPEQIQMMRDYQKEHEKLMQTDPEYRKKWEKRRADLEKIALVNDSIDSIQKGDSKQ